MRTVAQRELRNDSGRVLAAVAAGEVIEVTSNGTVMAVMVPPTLTPLQRGRLSGRMIPAKKRIRVSDIPLSERRSGIASQAIIDELKGDR